MSLEIIAAGFLVGTLIGLTGMGGGSLITPIMIFVFRVPPLVAVGTDLALSAITKFAGSIAHYRLGNVDTKIVRTLLFGSVPGALLGLIVLRILPFLGVGPIDGVIKNLLGGVLLVVAVSLFFPSLWKYVRRPESASGNKTRHLRLFSFGIGFIVAMTSIGSGSLMVPFLMTALTLPLSRVVGVDVVHGAAIAAVAGAGHLAAGSVDYRLLLQLLIGSVPGVLLGSRLSVLFPKRTMELVLGSMLVISGIKLL